VQEIQPKKTAAAVKGKEEDIGTSKNTVIT